MSTFKRFVASVAVAAVVVATMAAGASAYNLSFSPGGDITATISSLSFGDTGGLIRVSCPATLSGSLASGPITVATGSAVGALTSATVGTCTSGTGGSASGSGLPGTDWEMQVNTVLGILPDAATGLLLDVPRFAFLYTVSILGIPVRCLYLGTIGLLFALRGSNPYTIGTGTFLSTSVPFASGGASCPRSGRFSGAVAISPTQSVTFS